MNFTLPGEAKCRVSRGAELLSTDAGEYFVGSGQCVLCHSTDSTGQTMVDADGNDVSMVNNWMGTMMANSARDPFWRAKVSHEVHVNPQLQEEIETTCTRCHAPQGHYEMSLTTGEAFTLAHLDTSGLAKDGVACMACHRMEEDALGLRFVGQMQYSEDDVAYGPFSDPWSGPMAGLTGISPTKGDHIRKSELCASCHSLFTETIDLDGNPTGNTFFEQSTYHEWLNSVYAENQTECQACHMPQVEGGAIAASQPDWLFEQQPFGRHDLLGGNEFMLRLMAGYTAEIDAAATPEQFLRTAERTRDQLQQASVEMTWEHDSTITDTAYFSVELQNLTGHKFPSGYPSRIAWIEFLVTTESGDTLMFSGARNADGDIHGRDSDWERHHNEIQSNEEVQIYEMVMSDVEGNPTTVLERALEPLKDNRIPPIGFTTNHSAYDTAIVAGFATSDGDFNKRAGQEGTGADIVHYHVGLNGYSGLLNVRARVLYQSLPVRWMDEMFSASTDEILAFKDMYFNTDNTPVEVQYIENWVYSSVVELEENELVLFPNPTIDGKLYIRNNTSSAIEHIAVFDASGRIHMDQYPEDQNIIQLPVEDGLYYVVLRTNIGNVTVKVLKVSL
ncbi:MAG: T9SS type A sorting domain-containing protein [Flavobacteriales bacterium]|nr:T9SS type A sorting domain-containing protein [Flavobacteriales bacterium]